MPFAHRHLLGIEPLRPEDITAILDLAETYVELNRQAAKHADVLAGLTQINMFFETSTRTQASFELAGKRLGADVMNMAMQSSSSRMFACRRTTSCSARGVGLKSPRDAWDQAGFTTACAPSVRPNVRWKKCASAPPSVWHSESPSQPKASRVSALRMPGS